MTPSHQRIHPRIRRFARDTVQQQECGIVFQLILDSRKPTRLNLQFSVSFNFLRLPLKRLHFFLLPSSDRSLTLLNSPANLRPKSVSWLLSTSTNTYPRVTLANWLSWVFRARVRHVTNGQAEELTDEANEQKFLCIARIHISLRCQCC